jgi:ATP-dependent Clp protease ATP-binding subunit ClpA
MPSGVQKLPELTSTFQATIQYAIMQAEGSGQKAVNGGNILAALYQAEQSYAVYLLKQQNITRLDVLNYIAHGISKIDENFSSAGAGDFEGEEFAEDRAKQKQKNPLESLPSNSSLKPPKAVLTR